MKKLMHKTKFVVLVVLLVSSELMLGAMAPIPPEKLSSVSGMECGIPETQGTGPLCEHKADYEDNCQGVYMGKSGICKDPEFECDKQGAFRVMTKSPTNEQKCTAPDTLKCCNVYDGSEACAKYQLYTCQTKTVDSFCSGPIGLPGTPTIPMLFDNYRVCDKKTIGSNSDDGKVKVAVECL